MICIISFSFLHDRTKWFFGIIKIIMQNLKINMDLQDQVPIRAMILFLAGLQIPYLSSKKLIHLV